MKTSRKNSMSALAMILMKGKFTGSALLICLNGFYRFQALRVKGKKATKVILK